MMPTVKSARGASLVQLYSALIYQGFAVVTQIKERLNECLLHDGFTSISEAVGVDVNK